MYFGTSKPYEAQAPSLLKFLDDPDGSSKNFNKALEGLYKAPKGLLAGFIKVPKGHLKVP